MCVSRACFLGFGAAVGAGPARACFLGSWGPVLLQEQETKREAVVNG